MNIIKAWPRLGPKRKCMEIADTQSSSKVLKLRYVSNTVGTTNWCRWYFSVSSPIHHRCLYGSHFYRRSGFRSDARVSHHHNRIPLRTRDSCLKYIQVKSLKNIVTVHHSKCTTGAYTIQTKPLSRETIEQMCNDVGTEPFSMFLHHSSTFYCSLISIPVLDHLLTEMKSRFSAHQKTA